MSVYVGKRSLHIDNGLLLYCPLVFQEIVGVAKNMVTSDALGSSVWSPILISDNRVRNAYPEILRDPFVPATKYTEIA